MKDDSFSPKERFKRLNEFVKGTADEHVSAFAAQTAFFIFLAFFPLVSLLMALSRFLPYSQEQIIQFICYVLPARFEEYVISIVDDIYSGTTNTLTVASAAITLWSSAKGLMALRNGLNEIYRKRERRNYIIIRSISSLYTILFIVLLLAMIPLNMFGTQIALFVMSRFPKLNNLTLLIYGLRTGATFIVLFLFFSLMYTIVPTRRLRYIRQIPGAVFSAASWVLVTKVFSLYIDRFLTTSYMYGSLTMVVLIMFWLYTVVSLLFMGGQINEYLYEIKYAEIDELLWKQKLARRRERRRKLAEKRARKGGKSIKVVPDDYDPEEAELISEEDIDSQRPEDIISGQD